MYLLHYHWPSSLHIRGRHFSLSVTNLSSRKLFLLCYTADLSKCLTKAAFAEVMQLAKHENESMPPPPLVGECLYTEKNCENRMGSLPSSLACFCAERLSFLKGLLFYSLYGISTLLLLIIIDLVQSNGTLKIDTRLSFENWNTVTNNCINFHDKNQR